MNSMIQQDSNEGFKYRKIFKIVMCKITRLQNFIQLTLEEVNRKSTVIYIDE